MLNFRDRTRTGVVIAVWCHRDDIGILRLFVPHSWDSWLGGLVDRPGSLFPTPGEVWADPLRLWPSRGTLGEHFSTLPWWSGSSQGPRGGPIWPSFGLFWLSFGLFPGFFRRFGASGRVPRGSVRQPGTSTLHFHRPGVLGGLWGLAVSPSSGCLKTAKIRPFRPFLGPERPRTDPPGCERKGVNPA